MLYTEWKWSKRPGPSGFKAPLRKIGVSAKFARGSQGDFAIWKVNAFAEQYAIHQWFQILVFDNLSNKAENSPLSNERLRQAQNRCWQCKPGPAWKRRG